MLLSLQGILAFFIPSRDTTHYPLQGKGHKRDTSYYLLQGKGHNKGLSKASIP